MYNIILQGSTLSLSNATSPCNSSAEDLFGPNDECSRAVRQIMNGTYNNNGMDVFSGDCPIRLHFYVTRCRSNIDNEEVLSAQLIKEFNSKIRGYKPNNQCKEISHS